MEVPTSTCCSSSSAPLLPKHSCLGRLNPQAWAKKCRWEGRLRDSPCFLQTLPGQRCHDLGPASDPLDHPSETLPGMYVRPLDSLELVNKIRPASYQHGSTHYVLGWTLRGETGGGLFYWSCAPYATLTLRGTYYKCWRLSPAQNPIMLPSLPSRLDHT